MPAICCVNKGARNGAVQPLIFLSGLLSLWTLTLCVNCSAWKQTSRLFLYQKKVAIAVGFSLDLP